MHRSIVIAMATVALLGALPARAAAPSSTWGTKPVVAFTRASSVQREILAATVDPRFGTKPVLWNTAAPRQFPVVQMQTAGRSYGEKAALWTVRSR